MNGSDVFSKCFKPIVMDPHRISASSGDEGMKQPSDGWTIEWWTISILEDDDSIAFNRFPSGTYLLSGHARKSSTLSPYTTLCIMVQHIALNSQGRFRYFREIVLNRQESLRGALNWVLTLRGNTTWRPGNDHRTAQGLYLSLSIKYPYQVWTQLRRE